MGKYVALEMAKMHLNIEDSYTDEDSYIESLIEVSEAKIAKELCITVEELADLDDTGDIPAPLKQAILLSVGGYYAYREDIITVKSNPLEQGTKHILELYRDYSL